jgi:hypothetical protein
MVLSYEIHVTDCQYRARRPLRTCFARAFSNAVGETWPLKRSNERSNERSDAFAFIIEVPSGDNGFDAARACPDAA